MARLGADAPALGELGASMRLAARTLDTIAGDLDRRVRSAGWRGRDADRFLHTWTAAHRDDLRRCADRLGQLGIELRTQATQQRAASAATGEASPSGATPQRPTASSQSVFAPLPRAEVRYLGGVEVKLGLLSVALNGSLTIQQLPDERSRVVWTEAVSGGVTVGAGATADVSISEESFSGAPTAGLSADGSGRVGPVLRRSWEVHHERVDDLLMALALEQAMRAGLLPVGALSSAAGVIDGVFERVTGLDPKLDEQVRSVAAPPPADRTEQLLEVVLTGGVGAGLTGALGVGAQVSSTGSLRAGVMRTGPGRDPRRHLVVETNGTSAGVVSSTLLRRLGVELPSSARTVTSARFEMPMGDGHAPGSPITVHLIAGDGVEMTEVRAAISGVPELGSSDELGASVRALARGDLDDALARLASIDPSGSAVEVSVSSATVDGTSARAGASLSAGLRAGVGARGQVLEISR